MSYTRIVLLVLAGLGAAGASAGCGGEDAGGGGGGAGGGGAGGGATDVGALTVPNCAHKTVTAVEQNVFVPKCSANNLACHKGSGTLVIYPPRLDNVVDPAWKNMRDVKAKVSCTTVKYIDPADHAKSFVLTKIKMTAKSAMCPDGSTNKNLMGEDLAHEPMPQPQNVGDPFVPLSADELTCVEEYVKVVAAAVPPA